MKERERERDRTVERERSPSLVLKRGGLDSGYATDGTDMGDETDGMGNDGDDEGGQKKKVDKRTKRKKDYGLGLSVFDPAHNVLPVPWVSAPFAQPPSPNRHQYSDEAALIHANAYLLIQAARTSSYEAAPRIPPNGVPINAFKTSPNSKGDSHPTALRRKLDVTTFDDGTIRPRRRAKSAVAYGDVFVHV